MSFGRGNKRKAPTRLGRGSFETSGGALVLSGATLLLLVILLRIGTRLPATLLVGLIVLLLRVAFLLSLAWLIALLLAGVILLFLIHTDVASLI
jgi:hypothetical protein